MNISKFFWDRLKNYYSPTDVETIKNGLIRRTVCAFRVNTLKSSPESVEKWLKQNNIAFETIPQIPLCYTIDRKDEYALKGSPLFYEGEIYLQSVSSQIPALFLELQKGLEVLDMCAAPGGKTSQISAIMNNTGKITACEKFGIRFDKLKYTLRQQGCNNTESLKADAFSFHKILEKESFDAILLDAPCSAEGRIDFNEEKTFGFWSEQNIQDKAKYQKQLIDIAWEYLKPSGVLVYSTCTLALEENEEVVAHLLDTHENASLIPIELPISQARSGLVIPEHKNGEEIAKSTLRIMPSGVTEWFFVAKMKKRETF